MKPGDLVLFNGHHGLSYPLYKQPVITSGASGTVDHDALCIVICENVDAAEGKWVLLLSGDNMGWRWSDEVWFNCSSDR